LIRFSVFFLLAFFGWSRQSALAASDPFYWGVANAAIQTEGEAGDSDWSAWAKIPGKIDDGSNPNQAFGFYRGYEREFDTAKELGVNAFRLSVAWERVEPKRGEWNEEALAHYEKMMLALRSRGIEPMVTLHHFVNPAWLKDGVLNPEFPERFALYAEKVVARLSNGPARVRWWFTLNEPMAVVTVGYLDGQFPPGHHGDLDGATQAMAQLIRAHFRALDRMRALPGGDRLKVGIAAHWRPFEPLRGWNPLDRIAAYFSEQFFDRQFMDAVLTGKIDVGTWGGPRIRETIPLPGGRPGVDFAGINYYGRTQVGFLFHAPYVSISEGPGSKTDLGWEIFPEGLFTTLRQVAPYGLPILISENGIADAADLRRASFIRDHVVEIRRAKAEGIPVVGYLYWTLTDNFEWARGLAPKFGLCPAPDSSGKRRCRPSFGVYRDLIRASPR
jgi:beta-glucosidase